ncbi:MAG TPA: dihydrodipicolinate synthase family protein [Chloroflexota bacterium]|jgi:4-hydroxy-tetrahydrodipicolinate synthase
MDYRKAEAKEAARAQFHGVWAAITTPFTPDGDLDEAGLRHNMRAFTDGLKVQGIFCTGTMGEFWALTGAERRRVVEVVCEEARGKCRVIAHTAHHSARETVELTRHAEEAGADFAVLINPYFPAGREENGVYDWFAYVAARVDIGIWMFDTGYSAYSFSPELTARIAGLENVCGIKLGRPMDHYLAVKRLCGDQIVMSHPSEADWLMLMRDHGQQVHMSSPAPYLLQTPGYLPIDQYTALGLGGEYAKAATISAALDPARAVFDKWVTQPWQRDRIMPNAFIKAWCELLGLAGGPVRAPLCPITDAQRAELRDDLARVGLLQRVPAGA